MSKKSRIPHPIDLHVGKQLRAARLARGWSQQYLGAQVNEPITFQQVQKYERGINRTSASMLHEFATLLNVSITFFFPEGTQDIPLMNHGETAMLHDMRAMPTGVRKALGNLIAAMRC